jgi:hypothetical protein
MMLGVFAGDREAVLVAGLSREDVFDQDACFKLLLTDS